ncbi:unnamed protein product [Plutella xylostella]|uniref:Odorant receptor n=1 Tax=Plutella xylostella TaxID=51655 RepID=A0A8S4EVR1_PLUXY|nr:unnamed protein product [Plutella xylostella]
MDKSTLKKNFHTEITFLNYVASKLFLHPRTEGKGNNRNFYGYHLIYSLVWLAIIQLSITLYLYGLKNLIAFTTVAPNVGVCMISALKYSIIYNNKPYYDRFFKHYGEDIWQTIPESKENAKVISKYTFISKVINRVFVCYSLPLVLYVDSFPWLIMKFQTKFLGKEKQLLYPFDGWYPFDKTVWYFAAYSWESLMTGIVVMIYMYSDMINIFSVTSICMEFRILGISLKNLVSDEDIQQMKGKDAEQVNRRIKNDLKTILAKHDVLAGMCKELDQLLGNTMFANYTSGCGFICLTAFTFTVVDDFYQSIRCFFFFLSLLAAVLDHCIIGQIISDHSMQLADAIYSSNWTHADQSTKRTLLILLMRTQKPFELTAKGFVTMDLNTFTDIMSTSYQFFNLLRTCYLPQMGEI